MTKADLLKVIRAKCMDCVCDQREEVKLCPSNDCPLHPYRMGKGPFKSPMSPAQMAARMKGLEKANAVKNVSCTS